MAIKKSFFRKREGNLALRFALGIVNNDPFISNEQRERYRNDILSAHIERNKALINGTGTEGAEFHFPIRSRR